MAKQNRVTPNGQIIATPHRGDFMGNRGILHDDRQEIIRPFRLKAWIICLLDFKGRKQTIMAPGQYTQLFFLDEATALAAGHRPCFECQRQRAQAFRLAWLGANPELAAGPNTRISQIDDVLHRERLTGEWAIRDRRKRTYESTLVSLPDGTFVDLNGRPYLVWGRHLHPWSPAGYGQPFACPADAVVTVLTPPSTVGALAYGYTPAVHSTATIV